MEYRQDMSEITIPAENIRNFIKNVLLKAGVRDDVAECLTKGLVEASLRGVDSHGIRLLPHYLEGVKKGRINPNPNYKFEKTSLSTGTLDGDHTFGHAAGMEAAKKAVELANEAGTGHVAVYNSSHFGAAAYYALEIARHDMIGASFTNTDALIKTYSGKKAFFGNNPICFTVPCENEEPFCLDMATSVVTFNKVRQLKEEGKDAPPGAGADSAGIESVDPNKISMLLPVGGYKGYGLSMFVEILCSLLTGMPYGPHIPKMFEAPMNNKRFLGHFITAMRIDCFQDKDSFKKRFSGMINEIRKEPRLNENVPIRIAGDPEKNAAHERKKRGIPLKKNTFELFMEIGKLYGINFDGNYAAKAAGGEDKA